MHHIISIIVLTILFYGCTSHTAETNIYRQHEIEEGEYWHSHKPSLKMKEESEERYEKMELSK